MLERSKLVKMRIENLGCIGPEGFSVDLDDILCIVGPNNAGKSSVMRAYELAVGDETFLRAKDLCQRAEGQPTLVEIWVHIPKDTANIAEKWKMEVDGHLLVKSKWVWSEDTGYKKNRYTWDPEIDDYAKDGKASGLDTVFQSRLPKPFRVGTLEDPQEEHKKLLTLVLQPIADVLKASLADENSRLHEALKTLTSLVKQPVEEEKKKLESIEADINASHGKIFPNLSIDFNIDIGDVEMDPLQQLTKNSRVRFQEWDDEVDWVQQGTGSQRALFWAMLQVRSNLKTLVDLENQTKKEISDYEKKISRLERDIQRVKKEETRQKKRDEIAHLRQCIEQKVDCTPEALLEEQSNELTLPGYMLLIDEPEIALHPSAVRAASNYLNDLAKDPAWQVMLATHSPLFLDPLQDHTTIVRLCRSGTNPTPNTFRSDRMSFSADEKENLKMLNQFDLGLAEMFFGPMPILVEGDTEFAAFEAVMNLYPDKYQVGERPVLVRARGKHTLRLLIGILSQFKVPFSVLHDSDCPVRKDGTANGAWTANYELYECIEQARASGIPVIHRVSIPSFEFEHLTIEKDENGHTKEFPSKEKPWRIVSSIRSDHGIRDSIMEVLDELMSPDSRQEPFQGDFEELLQKRVKDWAGANSPGDPRFNL